MPQQFQNNHVVLAQWFIGFAGTNNVANECRPISRPFKFQYLK